MRDEAVEPDELFDGKGVMDYTKSTVADDNERACGREEFGGGHVGCLNSSLDHNFAEVHAVSFEKFDFLGLFAHEGEDDGESCEFFGDFT